MRHTSALGYAPNIRTPRTPHGAGQVARSGTGRRRVRTPNARETACGERPLLGGCALPSGGHCEGLQTASGMQSAVPEACTWGSSSSH
eukprot:scaffold4240_cov73-Phaeocystis_antarctica.AAC.3